MKHRSSEQDLAPADPQSIITAVAESEALLPRHDSLLMLTWQSKGILSKSARAKCKGGWGGGGGVRVLDIGGDVGVQRALVHSEG